MNQRLLPLVAVLLFAAGCGSSSETTQYKGLETKGIQAPPVTEDGKKLVEKMDRIRSTKAKAVKDEAPVPPTATKFFLLTESYEETGFIPESLRHEVKEADVAGKLPYVRVSYFDNRPENAALFDSFDNNTNRVEYKWTPDFKIEAAEYQSRAGAMLKMYKYCPRAEGQLDIHEHNAFRIHKAYTARVTIAKDKITVTYVDGHDLKGELPLWAECKELDSSTDAAKPYESPWGTHKVEFVFTPKGELQEFSRFNLAGTLDSDYKGIAKKKMAWSEEGRLLEQTVWDNESVTSHLKYDWENGQLARRKILDAAGNLSADYLGIADYEYTYDKKGRKTAEKHYDARGALVGSRDFEYNRKGYLTLATDVDKDGKLLRSYEHKYDKKGLRTEYNIYEGAVADGKLALDDNGVASYRWSFNKEGYLTEKSYFGLEYTTDAEGKRVQALVNSLDGYAKAVYVMDDKSEVKEVRKITVDKLGNAVKEAVNDAEGNAKELIERTFQGSALVGAKKSLIGPDGLVFEIQDLDAAEKPVRIAKLTYNEDGLPIKRQVFGADGTSRSADEKGIHQQIFIYDAENGNRLAQEYWMDASDVRILTITNEYSPEGKLVKTTKVDSKGAAVR